MMASEGVIATSSIICSTSRHEHGGAAIAHTDLMRRYAP